MHTQAHLGVGAQFGLHLALVNLAVGPMLLAFRHTGAVNPSQGRCLGYLFAVLRVYRPITTQRQGDAMAVLPVYQHVFVHQQINQRECLGKQNDNKHQPEGAGEETLWEPQRGFHR